MVLLLVVRIRKQAKDIEECGLISVSLPLSLVFYVSIVTLGLWVWVGSTETIGKHLPVFLRVKWDEKQDKKTELSKDWHWSKHRKTTQIFKGIFFFFLFLFKNCCQSSKYRRLFAKPFKDVTILRSLLHVSTVKGLYEHLWHVYPNKRKEVQRGCALKKVVNVFKKFSDSSSATWLLR